MALKQEKHHNQQKQLTTRYIAYLTLDAWSLFLLLLMDRSTSRYIDGNAEKGGTITSIYEDVDTLYAHHRADNPEVEEAVEDNEVISVRLLNSHHLIPLPPNSAEMQNISYENVQELRLQPDTAASSVNEYLLESTTAEPEPSPNMETVTITDDSLEVDWIRSRIEIPDSSEQSLVAHPTTTKPTTEISFDVSTSTVKIPFATTTVAPRRVFYGIRQRRVRNNDYYDDLPDIDFDQLDLDSLEESRFNVPRLRDLLARRFAPESEEQQPVRRSKKQQTPSSAKQPNLKQECPCRGQQPQPKPVENNAAHQQPEQSQQQRQHQPLPRLKRLLTGPQHRRLADDLLDESASSSSSSNLSIERAERVEGALERIMGIASIMSHVDRFIQQKTKQSIRRLAKLYESYEEVDEYE